MIFKVIYYFFSILLNRLLILLPLNEKRVLFLSDVRGDVSGNFEFVYKKISSLYDVHFSLKDDRRSRRKFRQWIEQCYLLATSKYIFLDDYSVATAYIHVRKNQELVQLWHGSGAYKKFAHSRAKADGDIKRIHAGYKRYTKTITSSLGVCQCFAEAFSIPVEHVLATGIPRTDIFFDQQYAQDCRKRLYKEYPGCVGRKVILFAPTCRGTKVEDAYYDFDALDIEKFIAGVGKKYIVLIKWHPAVYNNLRLGKIKGYDLSKYEGSIYDISEAREINDFLFITDILITDYSSLIFDYALFHKPIIYYTYDLQEYVNGRGLYYEFEEYVYGSVAENTDELIQAVHKQELCEEKREKFVRRFVDMNDGHATDRVISNILENNRC